MQFHPPQRPKSWPAIAAACLLPVLGAGSSLRADVLDQIGVRILWTQEPNLTGSGVIVAQPEATTIDDTDPNNPVDENDFEVNPSFALDNPIIVYINSTGASSMQFSNTNGIESVHADTVATNFYGTEGPAPGVAEVYNYNANYFLNTIISNLDEIPAQVINQSFIFTSDTPDVALQVYDNYVDEYNAIIVTAAGNGGPVQLPGTAYNVITVGAYGGGSSVGTSDGRSKPDITAPAIYTSFSTPLVSGVAAELVQAGTADAGGAGTSVDATDVRTIKALLLNGATKPSDWSHTDTTPLDPVYGAGIVNANASYHNLAAGEYKPVANGSTLLPSSGWNLQTLTSSSSLAATDVYPISVNIGAGHAFFTATLVWNRPYFDTSNNTVGGINNLDLYLVNTATDTTVAQSISTIDNVQQIYLPAITAGTYDLEVVKPAGAAGDPGWVSDLETYSLAWATSLYADANDDGTVNNTDLVALLTHFGTTSGNSISTGDFNGDGTVNNTDLVALLTNYDQTIGAPTAMQASKAFSLVAAPEPASLLMLAVAGTMLLAGRRRRSRL